MGHGAGLVAVTEKAFLDDGPAEVLVLLREPRRQTPCPVVRVPANRRLDQATLAVDREGLSLTPRTDGEGNLGLQLGRRGLVFARHPFSMHHLGIAPFDRIA